MLIYILGEIESDTNNNNNNRTPTRRKNSDFNSWNNFISYYSLVNKYIHINQLTFLSSELLLNYLDPIPVFDILKTTNILIIPIRFQLIVPSLVRINEIKIVAFCSSYLDELLDR